MRITLPYVVALIVRGQGSKVPVTVFPHEIEVLKAMHGDDGVEITDAEPPVKEGSFETEDEYVRLQEYYKGNAELNNPTTSVFRNLDEFESSFGAAVGDSKEELLARAKELGIAATRGWSLAKIKQAIAEIEDAE